MGKCGKRKLFWRGFKALGGSGWKDPVWLVSKRPVASGLGAVGWAFCADMGTEETHAAAICSTLTVVGDVLRDAVRCRWLSWALRIGTLIGLHMMV